MKRFRKIHLFSHNDLDGYACNVAVRILVADEGEELIEHNCDYQQLESTLRENFPSIDIDRDLVIVSDISWRQSQTDITDFMKSCKNLVVADHHASSNWIVDAFERRNTVVSEESNYCGCQILEQILKAQGFRRETPIEDNLTKFTGLVSDWDLWTWADADEVRPLYNASGMMSQPAPRLSSWFEWCVKERSSRYFIESVLTFLIPDSTSEGSGKTFSYLLHQECDIPEFKKYFSETVKVVQEAVYHYRHFKVPMSSTSEEKNLDCILFVLPNGCQQKSITSMLAHKVLEYFNVSNYDCIALWVEGDDTVSLRYPKDWINLPEALKSCLWGGGGHRYAAGTTPGADYMEQFVRKTREWRI